ncbi:MAG: SulP family inorganic anion transporter [Betaproteobacteria bacterium]|nr:SulP family inorganic anion transporter [Betaproteobacteria bacterium]
MRFLEKAFPFLVWIKDYDRRTLKADLAAGCTVSLVLIPQSMANAQLAGLPAYHGLYAALLPAFIGGLFGSSRHIITSSVAVTSIMAAAALEPLVMTGTADYILYMVLLTFLVGVVQLTLGLCRMGALVNFLSLPVVSGFTNAAALIIASSQLSKIFGVSVESASRQYETVMRVFESALHYTHMPTVLMAAAAALCIWGVKRWFPKIPAVLATVALCTIASWALSFEKNVVTSIDAIASPATRMLIRDLSRQQQVLATTTEELNRLKLLAEHPPGSKHPRAAAIEATHAFQEKQLQQTRLMEHLALAREHLRSTLFHAVSGEDGEMRFYAVKSPGLIPGVETSEPEPELPKEHGARVWRIAVGGIIGDLNALHFRGGGLVVGSMPDGLPPFSLPGMDPQRLLYLLPQALVIAFMGFAESISMAKSAANRFGYQLDPNQELVGQGLANIAGSFTQTSPVSGSFSNTAVNIGAGGKTGMVPVIAAVGSLLALLFFTKALYYLPQPVLAVIVMRSVVGLVSVQEFRRAWTAQWPDGCVALITFGTTLYFAPHMDYGIGIGVILSLALFFYRSMRTRVVTLSSGPDNVLRDAEVFGLLECRHIAVIHFQGVLFFANAGALEDHIFWRLKNQPELRHIHLVCSGITHIDASGEDTLATLVRKTAEAGIGLSFSGVVGEVAEVLERTGVLKDVTWDNVFLSANEAIRAIHKRFEHDHGCSDCPLTSVIRHARALSEQGLSVSG